MKTKIIFNSWCIVRLISKNGNVKTLFMYPNDCFYYNPHKFVSIEVKPLKSPPDAVM